MHCTTKLVTNKTPLHRTGTELGVLVRSSKVVGKSHAVDIGEGSGSGQEVVAQHPRRKLKSGQNDDLSTCRRRGGDRAAA